MWLAFAGSHSTGKSALIAHIAARLPERRVTIIRDVARGVIARGFPLGMNSTVDAFTNYVRDQLGLERTAARQPSDALLMSDRTVLDAAGYARANAALPRPFVPSYFVEALREIWLAEASRYHAYVFLPIEFPMSHDGVRDVGEEYRSAVSSAIEGLLREHQPCPLLVVHGTIEQRAKQIHDFTNGYTAVAHRS